MILTAEADSLSTDAQELLEDCGLVGCLASRSDDLSVLARIDSTEYVRLLWESSEEDDINTHAVILKFGKKSEGAITESRERTADTLYNDLESVVLAIEGTTSDVTDDEIVPMAKCIQDTKERQPVTRSGLQRLRRCVCHLHHKQGGVVASRPSSRSSPGRVRSPLQAAFPLPRPAAQPEGQSRVDMRSTPHLSL